MRIFPLVETIQVGLRVLTPPAFHRRKIHLRIRVNASCTNELLPSRRGGDTAALPIAGAITTAGQLLVVVQVFNLPDRRILFCRTLASAKRHSTIQLADRVPVMSFIAGKVVPQTRVTMSKAIMPRKCCDICGNP